MAVSVTIKQNFIGGDRRETVSDVTFDSTYPTGGEPLTAANLGFTSRVDYATVSQTGGKFYEYDHAANKLKSYSAYGVETTNNTDLSAITVRIRAVGN